LGIIPNKQRKNRIGVSQFVFFDGSAVALPLLAKTVFANIDVLAFTQKFHACVNFLRRERSTLLPQQTLHFRMIRLTVHLALPQYIIYKHNFFAGRIHAATALFPRTQQALS
jgi:hypothetical protein